MEVPRGGGNRSTYNTTNLIKHLKNHHPMEHAAYCQAKSKANRYRKTSIGKYRDRIGSNRKISESDRELKNEIGTSLVYTLLIL